MSFDIETIYGLLPAIYRIRDAAVAESLDDLLTADELTQLQALRETLAAGGGLGETEQRDLARLEEKRLRGPLKALLTVIAEQVQALEENVEQLYDDQFIETCADWVVPYIADLIGYRALDPQLQERLGSARAEVANTIGFRRRKGTAAVLEELALDVTDWDAAVVEFFQRLAVTQYLNHIRVDLPGQATADGQARPVDQPGTVDLRRVDRLERIGTPFDPASHTADVRRIASSRGRYNIPNVGIFLWRVGSRQLTDSPAFQVDARRYLFHPLGANTQLYGAAERETDVTKLAGPLDVPLPITRRGLWRDLARLYGPGLSLSVQVGGQVVDAADVEACDLSDTGPDPETSPWAHASQTKVAIDPVLGRIAFPADVTDPVQVSFYYGGLANVGGGEYNRSGASGPSPVREVPGDRPDVVQALADLAGAGTVEIAGSGRYDGPAALDVQANEQLALRTDNESRPLLWLTGDLVVSGGDSGEVILDGLLIAGGHILVPAQVSGQPNRLQKLRLVDCTLVPGGALTRDGGPAGTAPSLEVAAANVEVEIERCILGGLRVSDESKVTMSDSIVDGLGPEQVAYAAPDGQSVGGELTVESCTLVGKVHTALLTASNAIFYAALSQTDTWSAPVWAERRQAGYVRYSYVPLGSLLPPRYACTPQTADQAQQVVPRFTSLRYGHPAYAQLHAACPCQIDTGADDQGEMGAYHGLYAPQHEAGLRVRLDEYLRFGLEAGLFFAS